MGMSCDNVKINQQISVIVKILAFYYKSISTTVSCLLCVETDYKLTIIHFEDYLECRTITSLKSRIFA